MVVKIACDHSKIAQVITWPPCALSAHTVGMRKEPYDILRRERVSREKTQDRQTASPAEQRRRREDATEALPDAARSIAATRLILIAFLL